MTRVLVTYVPARDAREGKVIQRIFAAFRWRRKCDQIEKAYRWIGRTGGRNWVSEPDFSAPDLPPVPVKRLLALAHQREEVTCIFLRTLAIAWSVSRRNVTSSVIVPFRNVLQWRVIEAMAMAS
jgi:hypothetical protein